MIKSFGDRKTERLFADHVVREFQGIARPAKRKLEALHAAGRLDDLRVPPSNRLEELKGDLRASIRSESTISGGSSFAGIMVMPMTSRSWTIIRKRGR